MAKKVTKKKTVKKVVKKTIKRYWKYMVNYGMGWQDLSFFLDDKGKTTTGHNPFKGTGHSWKTLAKVKIENNYIDLED